MKINPVGAEFLHVDRRTDGRTDMTKLTVAFRNFANVPENAHSRSVTHKISMCGFYSRLYGNCLSRCGLVTRHCRLLQT